MAKKHKHSNNGVVLDTALSIADLRSISARAALESTGDLWNGTHNIVESDSGDSWILYLVKGSVTGWNKFMTFMVTFGSENARSTLQTEIITYSTTQTTLMYFIPVSPKMMRARHTYLQFINKVANTVRQADPSARIAINEGEGMPTATVSSAGPPPTTTATAPRLPPLAPALPLVAQNSTVTPATLVTSLITQSPDGHDVDDRTHKVSRNTRSNHWMITPQGLASVPLVSGLVIGRQPSAGSSGGAIVTVPRTEDTVSKMHAKFELVDGVVYVTDLASINGTILVSPDDELIHCLPNTPTRLPVGYAIELGDFTVTVEAPASGDA